MVRQRSSRKKIHKGSWKNLMKGFSQGGGKLTRMVEAGSMLVVGQDTREVVIFFGVVGIQVNTAKQ